MATWERGNRPQTIRDLMAYNAEHFGERVWLTCPESGAVVTWHEAYEHSLDIAVRLGGLGLELGESVVLAAPNSLISVLSFVGITLAGGRATPLNLVAGDRVLAYVLGHSGARFILADESVVGDVERALSLAKERESLSEQVQVFRLDSSVDFARGVDVPPALSQAQTPEIERSSLALLMYTSGTTGNPKGVMLSHGNLLAAGGNVAEAHALTPADTGLCVLPIYHINGLCVTVMGSMVSASGLVMPPRFSTQKFWGQIYEHACSWFSAVPTLFSYILNDDRVPQLDTERLRFARSASAPLPPDIHRRFEARFGVPIIETMGLTETGAQILSNPLPPGVRKIGSPGIGFGNEVKIVAPESMLEVPSGTEGEIIVKGENVMLGYLDQPDETSRTLTRDGWLRTGDLGRMDDDGYIYVTGRIKELIIKGGENIAPREIDEVLLEHSTVLEAAAFGRPCADYGQRVEACIRLKDGCGFDHAALLSHCESRLGAFKAPDRIYRLDDLPKGPSGKVQRMKLIALVAELG